jgi:flagella basal body P-ring formation protein FlgA
MNRFRHRVLLSILVFAGLALSPVGYAAPGTASGAAPATVYLHRLAVLEDAEYTLGQVASIISSDRAQARTLHDLPLGPRPARPTLLPARLIRQRIGAVSAEAVVIGGRVALLPADGVPEDRRWFYASLLAFVDSQDTVEQGRIEIEVLSPPVLLEASGAEPDETGMASGWEDRIVFEAGSSPYSSSYRSSASSQAVPAGQMQVTYRILALGAQEISGFGSAPRNLEGSFRIWIHHFLPVARARTDLNAGQRLSDDLVSFSEEDVSLLRSSFFIQGEPLGNYETTASVRQGERIEPSRLQRVLAVRAGQRVTITFARPGLQVSLPGRALRSGSVGELVVVRPEATAKRFEGRITSRGEVFIENH